MSKAQAGRHGVELTVNNGDGRSIRKGAHASGLSGGSDRMAAGEKLTVDARQVAACSGKGGSGRNWSYFPPEPKKMMARFREHEASCPLSFEGDDEAVDVATLG